MFYMITNMPLKKVDFLQILSKGISTNKELTGSLAHYWPLEAAIYCTLQIKILCVQLGKIHG